MSKRKHKNFLDAWMEYHEGHASPKPFVQWAGLWLISAAVERRVWAYTLRKHLYPNIFVICLSPAGFGKGLVFDNARALIQETFKGEQPRLSVSSITTAAMTQALKRGARLVNLPNKPAFTYHALHVFSSEFKVLLPVYETSLIATLTDLYDCIPYGEERKSKPEENNFLLPHTYMTLFSATTPAHLLGTLPESAFEEGFMSRTFLIYSDDAQKDIDIFDADDVFQESHMNKFTDLAHDLKDISTAYGKFEFTEEAKNLIRNFRAEGFPFGGKPIPSHPKLLSYAARRTANIIKLSQLNCLARSDHNLTITEKDYKAAFHQMVSAEAVAPEIFRANLQTGDAGIIGQIHHEMMIDYAKTKKPWRDGQLTAHLLRHVQSYRVEGLKEMMANAGYMRRTDDGTRGKCWLPTAYGED